MFTDSLYMYATYSHEHNGSFPAGEDLWQPRTSSCLMHQTTARYDRSDRTPTCDFVHGIDETVYLAGTAMPRAVGAASVATNQSSLSDLTLVTGGVALTLRLLCFPRALQVKFG